MLLEGSCHCGAVSFRVEWETPYSYQACYCSICRKTVGGQLRHKPRKCGPEEHTKLRTLLIQSPAR
jgi:hypothetical protein